MVGNTRTLALAVLLERVVVDLAFHHRAKDLTGLVRGECTVDEREVMRLIFHDDLSDRVSFVGESGDHPPMGCQAPSRRWRAVSPGRTIRWIHPWSKSSRTPGWAARTASMSSGSLSMTTVSRRGSCTNFPPSWIDWIGRPVRRSPPLPSITPMPPTTWWRVLSPAASGRDRYGIRSIGG